MARQVASRQPRFIDLTGQRYGRLVAVSIGGVIPTGKGAAIRAWKCVCDCGVECEVRGLHLRHGHTRSCGCVQREKTREVFTKHGGYRLAEYGVWSRMNARCASSEHSDFYLYGARGITVCDRWRESFAAFLDDMGSRPTARHSIDRIDTNGHYEPSNCRWALPVVQANNTRRNVYLTINGQTMTAAQWADSVGRKRSTVYARLARGLSAEQALSIKGEAA